MNSFRFLHIADLHLDTKPGRGKIQLPPAKRAVILKRIKEGMEKIPEIVKAKKLDAVLIPGDLFHREPADVDLLNFTIDTFEKLSPMPVFLLPGNHDTYIPRGNYDAEWLKIQHGRTWPDNVKIFKTEKFNAIQVPAREDVMITGALTPTGETGHRLSQKIPVSSGHINILLFHGACMDGNLPGIQPTDPFTSDELLSQDFDYIALGHYHTFKEFIDENGKIRGAYSGAPWGQNLDESGEKFCLAVEVSKDMVCIDKIQLVNYVIRDTGLDISGLKSINEIKSKILEFIGTIARKDDIVYLRLEGRIPPSLSISSLEIDYDGICFHLVIDTTAALPDYDIGLLRKKGTMLEKEFIKNMEARIREEPEKKEILDSALYYGLDAIRGMGVSPR
ncbi:MAG: metallophosphoesterase [Candidatus Eremiobacteraeota bacterium]|nr:metallophosphoesterase [Candidatus Eremiobacteraeota bacterium]